jgi:hypothetical protein
MVFGWLRNAGKPKLKTKKPGAREQYNESVKKLNAQLESYDKGLGPEEDEEAERKRREQQRRMEA